MAAEKKADPGAKKLQAQDHKVSRAEQAHKRTLTRIESLQARRDRHATAAAEVEQDLTAAREAAALAQSSLELERRHRQSIAEYLDRKKSGESGVAEGYVEPEPGQEPTQTAS